ncbi:MAG: ATPase [Eubacterium sp.]|nr:ATPase [Eubacterium sp.]
MGGFVIGLDGGGTKTEVVVCDLQGNVISEFRSGAININGENVTNVESNLRYIFEKIFSETGKSSECAYTCVGAAGISNALAKETLIAAIVSSGYSGRLIISGDHQTALYGALGKGVGIILIAGTGSICYGRNKHGSEHRTGGFGYLIDDEGSGYAIGRDMLSAIVRAYDGREKCTDLKDMVFSQLKINSVEELVSYIYSKETNKRDIAKLAPNLTHACKNGDSVARAISDKCSDELFKLVKPVVEKLELYNGEIALSGSILTKDQYIRNTMVEKVSLEFPCLKCVNPKDGAAYGAAMMALEAAGYNKLQE